MIVDNVIHFARLLRRAGLSIGPDRVLQALAALQAVGVERRGDVQAALRCVMTDRQEQQPIFDAAFDTFWRDRKLIEQALQQPLAAPLPTSGDTRPAARLEQALAPSRGASAPTSAGHRIASALSASQRETLQQTDFARMSTAEFHAARALVRELALPVEPVRRRRHETAPRGRLDLRATMRRMARAPQTLVPAFTRPREVLPPVVVLLDISGSMQRYARLFLHYTHALMPRLPRLHVLTFGTRLTDITRLLRPRDPDLAMRHAQAAVHDWNGGTRIASTVDEFNRRHARRMLGGNACVLLVTDALDRDEGGGLGAAAARLRRLAHRVVWLNPLLRFDAFEPRAAGPRALLPHVDRMLPMHNLRSLADLGRALKALR